MFSYLILLFILFPILELAVLIKVGSAIGIFNTIFLTILTGVVGASLARYQGFITFQKIQNNLNTGVVPSEELLDGMMILLGGLTLLTPGFITDALGLMALIPATRGLLKNLLKKAFKGQIHKRQNSSDQTQTQVIYTEWEDVD